MTIRLKYSETIIVGEGKALKSIAWTYPRSTKTKIGLLVTREQTKYRPRPEISPDNSWRGLQCSHHVESDLCGPFPICVPSLHASGYRRARRSFARARMPRRIPIGIENGHLPKSITNRSGLPIPVTISRPMRYGRLHLSILGAWRSIHIVPTGERTNPMTGVMPWQTNNFPHCILEFMALVSSACA